jgi:hypothetical protein
VIYIAAGQLLVILALVAILVWRERQHDGAIKWMVESEQAERDKLVQRIQHPDREPVVRGAAAAPSPQAIERAERAYEVSEEHKANLAKVGTVASID